MTARRIIDDRVRDGVNIDTIKKAEDLEDPGIKVSTIIPLLLVDGDQDNRKQTHMHLIQDTTLDRHRTALKLILSQKQGDRDFHCLFKLAKVHFMLCKYDHASGLIQQALQNCPKTYSNQ